ncbi:heptahelical transmembrane protein 1 [Neltuma alba]|uniref:heptahelical transmembrane protein 1 n=1 Tax=Neltuma alba TaxID=207710 RepID=UPI0010A33CD2|nr:heptahelical transmembrane protein 1-like [Prosopis alba]
MSCVEARAVLKRKGRETMEETHLQALSYTPTKEHRTKKKTGKDQEEIRRVVKARRYPLLSFWELPEYMKDNEYILHYYRANWPLKQALLSVFRWHNETLNVWTHLFGFLLFLGLTLANLMQPQVADLLGLFTRSLSSSADKNVSQNFKDLFLGTPLLIDLNHQAPLKLEVQSSELGPARWPFFVFLGGSMFCLLSSSTCHLFSCHSHTLNLFLLRIDYVGITVMIITSFFPQIYYVFLCDPHWQIIYLGGITAMGLFTIITLLSPALTTNKYRAFRAMLFCSMGLFGIIPAIHATIVNWGNPRRNITLAYEAAMGLFYLTGTMFYVSRIPERWKPGWFDLAGHSHQIFHVFVVFGALAHYAATLKLLDWRVNFGCDRVHQ